MTRHDQPPLIPLITRPIPPDLLFNGDAATRSDQIRRLRARPHGVEWATYCAKNIDGWPPAAKERS